MKTPNVTSRNARSGKSRRRPLAPPLPFKVFIGYADVSAVRRAMCTVGDAVRSSSRNIELQPLLWRFAQLESDHWRDRAITAALEADVIVLANSEPGELPAGVESWVNAFLAANRGQRATIISVAGAAEAWTISIEHPRRQLQPQELEAVKPPIELVA